MTEQADEQSSPERWSASTVHADMWLDPDDDPRDSGATLGDERSTLLEYLRAYRLTVQMKCADLDAEQMARRSVPPSTMSLLGLIRHMAEVERHWFRNVLAGELAPRLFSSKPGEDGDWNGAVADDLVVDQAWSAWRDEVAFAEQFVEAAPDLALTTRHRDHDLQLREVLVHMIEEYARHAGHADLLRERIDGRVGQ